MTFHDFRMAPNDLLLVYGVFLKVEGCFVMVLEGFWNGFGISWIDFGRVTMTMADKVLGLLGVGHIDFRLIARHIPARRPARSD